MREFFRRLPLPIPNTILDKYLVKEFSGPFLLAVGGFALIAVVDILFYLVELAIISGISFFTVVRLLAYKLPAVMVLFFPMAVLFSVMLLLVRMAKDNELTILMTSGIKTTRFILPIIAMAFCTSFLSYVTNEKIVPWTNEASDKIIRQEIRRKPPPSIAENVVFRGSGNRHFFIKKVDSKQGTMENILVMEETTHFPRVTVAKEAVWQNDQWTLLDGHVMEYSQEGHMEFSDQFSQLIIHVSHDMNSFFKGQKTAKEMDSKELKRKIQVLKKGGISTRSLKVEYHMKKSIPLACFIFGIMGIGFCLSFVKTGKDWWGVIIAICVSVLAVGFYFFIVAIFRALSKDGSITPLLGAWIPNLVYAALGITMISFQAYKK
jgi:lipopolysaccharide export system permease protein